MGEGRASRDTGEEGGSSSRALNAKIRMKCVGFLRRLRRAVCFFEQGSPASWFRGKPLAAV